jgi:hypothetical protein
LAKLGIIDGLYALALLALPLSSGAKLALGLGNMTWIDPTLILGLILLWLLRPPLKPFASLLVIAMALISAGFGYWLLTSTGKSTGIYDVLREPIRLGLCMAWFWVSCAMLRRDKPFVLRWLAISMTLQLLLACIFWAGASGLTILPEPVRSYVQENHTLQYTALFDTYWIFRLCGTFIESPPFGLLMFSSFTIFSIALLKERRTALMLGWIISLIGTLGAFSDQVLLGLALLAGSMAWLLWRKREPTAILYLGVLVLASSFFAKPLLNKMAQLQPAAPVAVTSPSIPKTTNSAPTLPTVKTSKEQASQGPLEARSVYKMSGAERNFHIKYALRLLTERPYTFLLGVGPGNYGKYAAAQTGVFPETVTPQVTPVEWLVGYGLLGTGVILAWLWSIFKSSIQMLGFAGVGIGAGLVVANLFQANWTWEGWFLALAFLYVGQRDAHPMQDSKEFPKQAVETARYFKDNEQAPQQ